VTHKTDAAGLDLSQFIKAGDRIVIGQACGEPTSLVEALIAQGAAIGHLHAFIATSFSGIFTPESAGSFSLSSMGAIGALRTMAKAGALSIIPCHVSQIGPMIEARIISCDVAFVQVSPADADGNHSFGLTSDHVQAMVSTARVVIAEVNECVPFTCGEAVLPASKIDCAVYTSRDPAQVMPAKASATDEAIAKVIAAYVDDGSVLQVGVDLVEAGVMTNARKPFDAGISITGALIGSKRLFAHAHQNTAIRMCSAAFTHSEAVLLQIPNLVTINSALEVDLTGQVNAEASGSFYLGGTGGQVDYVRAGSRAPGGHAIIALTATAKGGSLSKIVSALSGPVTTARADVDKIVTEFGVAELKGQPLAERARRLAAIAHPDFRAELDKAAFEINRRGF
jgi:acyl-CoA hydrolase